MLGGSLISTVLGTDFPGPGTIYVSQSLRFLRPVHPGDRLTVTVTVTSLDTTKRRAVLDTRCVDQDGAAVIEGEAEVVPPREKLRIRRTELPEVLLADKNMRYQQLLAGARHFAAIRMAVVHPCSREALTSALDAARLRLILPVLVGPAAEIRQLAAECGIELGSTPIVDLPHSQAAAQKAVAMARSGEVEALMTGSLHIDQLLAAVVAPGTGLRTGRRMSHVFVLDVPRYAKPLLVTDAAINVDPDLEALSLIHI